MPSTSYSSVQVRKRPPLPPPEMRRPLTTVASTYSSVPPYRPLPNYTSHRSGSVPPPSRATGGNNLPTTFGIGSATIGWRPITEAGYQPRASSLPPLSSSTSYRLRALSRAPIDDDIDDIDDDDVISTTRSSNLLRSRSKYSSNPAQRAALKLKSNSYFDDIQEKEDAIRKSLTDLRTRTSQAQATIDQHKRLIDRYRTSNGPVATYSGTTSSGTDRKYYDSNLSNVSSAQRASTPSYRSGSATTSEMTPAIKPGISDARRKLRKVLADSKGDRRYYD